MSRVLRVAPVIVFFFLAPFAWSQESPAPIGLMRRTVSPAVELSPARRESVTVPALTLAHIQLLSGIHSRVSHVDDRIEAQLLEPVVIDGRVALPPGSLLDGRITHVRGAGRLHSPGELAFRFEQITLPDGQSEPLTAVLASLDRPGNIGVDSEGYLKARRGAAWKGMFGGFLGLGAFSAVKLATAGAGVFWPVLPAAGSAFLGYEILWPRGRDVNLPPQTLCRVRLNYPLTVRVAW